MDLIEVDQRRRISLPKAAKHDRYLYDIGADGTITLVPAVVRPALENSLRAVPGFMERLERNAADCSHDVTFTDWRDPD